MLDRLAKAAYDANQFVKPWDHPDSVRLWHKHYRDQARAVLMGLREPSEGLRNVLMNEINELTGENVDDEYARHLLRLITDEAMRG